MGWVVKSRRSTFPAHRALVSWPLVSVAASTAVLLAAGLWGWGFIGGSSSSAEFVTRRPIQGVFVHDIVERGEVESSVNVAVRCEVQSRSTGSNGVKIIEIVPEGTFAKQGDFLVKFDDAALQSERTTQQINVSSAEAAAAQSANDLEAAVIARKEYEFGEFESEREKMRGEIMVATENLSRAAESVEFTSKLVRRGYLSRSKLRSDKFDMSKADSDLKIAKTKLNALVEYTRAKKLSELDAKVKTCDAKLKSDEAKLALERQKLEVLENQIAKCVVTAPAAGQVIYDHEQDHWRGAEYQIKQGTVIHEQRVVIRLPDPKHMQVVAKVAESRIDKIKPGMAAKVEIEGLPGVELTGKVTKVNEYPAPENWFNSSVKEYATTVEIVGEPTGLRPGMTAKVAIRVETIPDAVQVPIQAVVERGGKHYCLLVQNGGALLPREVMIGSTNESFLVVRDGLSNQDEVLVNPRAHLDLVRLPEAPQRPGAIASQPVEEKSASAEPRRATTAVGDPGS